MSLAVLVQGPGSGPEAGEPASFGRYLELARIAERGKLDALLLPAFETADGEPLAAGGVDGTAPFDAVMLMASLAAVTEKIGLLAAADPTFDHPYNIARRIVSADHLSRGRAGWILALGCSSVHALNYSMASAPPRAERVSRAREFAEVVKGLWDSWDDDAFILDRARGRYFDPTKMHFLQHEGEHFQVRGPLNVARSVQGQPVIAHAGEGEDGRALAAEVADLVYAAPAAMADAQAYYAGLKRLAARFGRPPAQLKVMPQVRVAGGGASEAMADDLEQRFVRRAADGFTLVVARPSELLEVVELVIPLLQQRGLFRTDYEGRYLREHLGLEIPPAILGGERAWTAAQ